MITNNKVKEITDEVKKVIVGKDEAIDIVMKAILADGHILLEDIPGVGKTTMALAFSKAMNLKYNRIQFTPDVMPSDITGFSMYNKKTEEFEYKEGAVICNFLLADEINRTTSKTQSALLEAMEERRVTVDGITRILNDPFIVIATQNPLGTIGTSALPESQLDRFMIKISMGYPKPEEEFNMLKNKQNDTSDLEVKQVADVNDIIRMKEEVKQVFVHDEINQYIVKIVNSTRNSRMLNLGVSPRGTIAIANMTRANAYVNGRDFCTPEDVRKVIFSTIKHRIILSNHAKSNRRTEYDIIKEIILNTMEM